MFEDNLLSDMEKIRIEGPLNPLELNRRANIALSNNLVVTLKEMINTFDEMYGYHEETRQVQAEAIQKVMDLGELIKNNPNFEVKQNHD